MTRLSITSFAFALLACDSGEGDPYPAADTNAADTSFFPDSDADTADIAPPDTTTADADPGQCAPEPQTSCDGGDGCFRWSLRGMEIPPQGTARITWRLEQFCEAPLDEASFGFAPGVTRLAPADFASYTSPEGSEWTVAHDDRGCAGFRFVRRSGAEPGGATTFAIDFDAASIDPDTIFANSAKAGDATGAFATRASACFVFTTP